MVKQNLKCVEGHEMRSVFGDKGIKDMINLLNPDSIMVEIGCYFGESTLLWASSEKIKKIIAVDPWVDFYDKNDLASERGNMKIVEQMFDDNTKENPKIEKIKGYSVEVSNNYNIASLDFVYIDGCHTYEEVMKDINAWKTKIKHGGFIGGHDYNWDGVRRAINETIGVPDSIFEDSSWIKKL
jgi:hypothetical protein